VDPSGEATAKISVGETTEGGAAIDGNEGTTTYVQMTGLYNKGKDGDCSCCEKIYWRQYAKTTVVGLRNTRWLWQSFEFDVMRNEWHLDGGKIYGGDQTPEDHNPNEMVYTMWDAPGASPTNSYIIKSIRQYFAAQVICEKKDGTEIGLTDQVFWGHEYDYDRNPMHRWFPKEVTPVNAYDCKNGISPAGSPSTTPTMP
jgi:hypothetical protein